MFDKKQKSCVKRIHLVTDDGLYDRKAFYTVKIVFYSSSFALSLQYPRENGCALVYISHSLIIILLFSLKN